MARMRAAWDHDTTPREDAMPGTLDPRQIRQGKPRGRHGLFQRRVRARVFGEPAFEVELVPAHIHDKRPHIIAYHAWLNLAAAAEADGQDPAPLAIHSAYRSVAFQKQIWDYRLEERRQKRRAEGEPDLPPRDLARIQRKWTAQPGASAHHTGLALDLALSHLGPKGAKRSPAYTWLAQNAARFGFYPYFPEGWHWEYNPPGLVERIAALREVLERGEPFAQLLVPPDPTTRRIR